MVRFASSSCPIVGKVKRTLAMLLDYGVMGSHSQLTKALTRRYRHT